LDKNKVCWFLKAKLFLSFKVALFVSQYLSSVCNVSQL